MGKWNGSAVVSFRQYEDGCDTNDSDSWTNARIETNQGPRFECVLDLDMLIEFKRRIGLLLGIDPLDIDFERVDKEPDWLYICCPVEAWPFELYGGMRGVVQEIWKQSTIDWFCENTRENQNPQ